MYPEFLVVCTRNLNTACDYKSMASHGLKLLHPILKRNEKEKVRQLSAYTCCRVLDSEIVLNKGIYSFGLDARKVFLFWLYMRDQWLVMT